MGETGRLGEKEKIRKEQGSNRARRRLTRISPPPPPPPPSLPPRSDRDGTGRDGPSPNDLLPGMLSVVLLCVCVCGCGAACVQTGEPFGSGKRKNQKLTTMRTQSSR